MSFNPNEPPRSDQGPGPRQNQEPQDAIADAFRAIDQQGQLRQIMARSPTTTIPLPNPAHGRQQ